MSDQALNSALQRHGGRRAPRTGSMHRQIKVPVTITFVDDVTAVLGNCRPDPRFDQLLDLLDDVGVGWIFIDFAIAINMDAGSIARREQRRAADEVVEQGLQDDRFEITPRHTGRNCHRYEFATVKYAFDHAAVEESLGNGRGDGAFSIGEIARTGVHDGLARQELAGRGIWRLLGPDQHASDVGRRCVTIKKETDEGCLLFGNFPTVVDHLDDPGKVLAAAAAIDKPLV